MSDIRFNNWLHQSGTGGVYQDSSGNVGIGTSVPSANLDVEGTINANTAVISGNLTVEGVLTYDDVTNIDSVGVVTARDGIDITSGDIVLNKSRSDTHASLIIDKPDAGSGTIKFYNNGLDSGYIQHTNAEHLHYYLPSGSGYHAFYTNGSNERLRITDTGLVRVPDGGKFVAGAGDDLQIFHGGSLSYIANYTGELIILNQTNDSDVSIHSDNGSGGTAAYFRADGSTGDAILYHYGTEKLATKSTGVEVSGATKTDTLEVTQEYPTIRPTLDLNFAATKVLDDRITFTRDSVGTYIDENGVLKYASNNTPRFDHDIETGESLGLLIEQSSTNLFLHGENFTASYWTKNGGGSPATTVTADQAAAPDGTMTADYIDYTTATGNSQNIERQFDSTPAGKTYTASVFIKGTAGQTINLTLDGYGVNGSASQHTLNGNWQRFSITRSYPSGHTQAAIFRFGCRNLNHPSTGTATQIHAWGAQLEQTSFLTSYIPSSSTGTVSRGYDLVKITGTNFSDFYNQTEGTVFSSHQQSSGQVDTQNTYVYQIANATSSSVAFRLLDKNNYYSDPARLTATQWSNDVALQKPDATNGERIKTAFACKVNDAAVSYNGATVLTDNSLDMNSGQIEMSIGGFTQSPQAFLNGHIQQISYYPKRLSNAQLQGLTQQ